MTINPTLRVYAFEPNVKCFSALSANGAHSNFTPINLALGERTGTLSLYDYAERDGSQHASVYKDVFDSIHKAPATETQIGVTTVDRFLSDSGIDRVALLKIDTEGNELDVLRGARDTLHAGRIEAIQLEFNEMNVVSRTFFRDIWKFLDGYDLYRLLPKALLPLESYTPLLCELFAFQNIVAIRKDRYTPH